MKLKNEIEYVFRILNYMSVNGVDKIIPSYEISESENIPHLFCIRILKKMEKKGLLKIYKGAKGGYKLNKKPEEISLRDAVETIETEIIIKDKECIPQKTSCSLIFDALQEVEDNFLRNLASIDFKRLSSEEKIKFPSKS